jgi:predicted RNase H-like HicB family nuclease
MAVASEIGGLPPALSPLDLIQRTETAMKRYLLVIEGSEGDYSAYFPDVLGLATGGTSVEEVRRNAAEGLELHLREDVPPPARPLAEIIADPEVELDGTETLAWIPYEQQHALA